MLSAFACTPSVLANDFPLATEIPLATLSVENIQVRAEWKMVDDNDNRFSVEDGILMLTSDISGAGYYPDGKTLTAIVEVRDKFSALNSSYEDLAVRVMITAVIKGCHADGTRNFARDDTPNRIKMTPRQFDFGAIAHRYTLNGFKRINLYTYQFQATFTGGAYITTSPTGLYDALTTEYTELAVNEHKDCFAEEANHLILAIHAPFITGDLAGEGRAVTVASASVSAEGKQVFSLDNLELANALNESYTPQAINDDGKAFRIDGSEQKGDTYEYYANITSVIDSVQKNTSHEVIVLNNCPPVVTVIAWQEGALRISESDLGKVKKYVVINGAVYSTIPTSPAGISPYKGIESHVLNASGFDTFSSGLADGDYPVKFSDHFLCGTE